ncbi:hypothetical protein DFH07DRAFT_769805 [Mycena maculata]|uniref:Uncharacterized protein n=1 Tax=Mycena maculata TaxID=230809 RepID=A0AAD7JK41_9AGAR|nr:hypothetical protein DFH07DRAFT_769805 [Mycena maculata]
MFLYRPLENTTREGRRRTHHQWEFTLCMIQHLPPRTPVWSDLLGQMHTFYLFYVAIRSKVHFDAVMYFLVHHGAPWASADENIIPTISGDRIFRVSREIQQEFVERMPLKDQVIFGATCKRNRALAARVLQLSIADVFKPYNIPYRGIQLMQAVTGAKLSGSVIPRIAMYSRQSSSAFTPNDVDFYAPHSTYLFVREFFLVGTAFKFSQVMNNIYDLPSITAISWLRRHVDNPLSINIMRCRGEHAMEPILQFHSTCVIGTIDASGLWLANPRTVAAGVSTMNPKYFKILTPGEQERAIGVIHKYYERGCGVEFECPATMRTTVDGGTTVIKFPLSPFRNCIPSATVFPGPYILTWNGGGVGCKRGIRQAVNGLEVKPVYDPYIRDWRARVRMLIARVVKERTNFAV